MKNIKALIAETISLQKAPLLAEGLPFPKSSFQPEQNDPNQLSADEITSQIDRAGNRPLFLLDKILDQKNLTSGHITRLLKHREVYPHELVHIIEHPKISNEDLINTADHHSSGIAREAALIKSVKRKGLIDKQVDKLSTGHYDDLLDSYHISYSSSASRSHVYKLVAESIRYNRNATAEHFTKILNSPNAGLREHIFYPSSQKSAINSGHVMQGLSDSDVSVRQAAISHMANNKDTIQLALSDPSPSVRQRAVIFHNRTFDQSMTEDALNDPHSGVKHAAIANLNIPSHFFDNPHAIEDDVQPIFAQKVPKRHPMFQKLVGGQIHSSGLVRGMLMRKDLNLPEALKVLSVASRENYIETGSRPTIRGFINYYMPSHVKEKYISSPDADPDIVKILANHSNNYA